jgi:NADPH:quinone reductase
MAHAIRAHKYGGPEVLVLEPVDIGAPAAGQIKLTHTAIGVNYIDTYHRTGLYAQPSFPAWKVRALCQPSALA